MHTRIKSMMDELEQIEAVTDGLDDEFYNAMNALAELRSGMKNFDSTEYAHQQRIKDIEMHSDQRMGRGNHK